jgi:hypothetical protein
VSSALLHKVDFFIVETEVRGIPDEQLLQFGFWPDTFSKIISVIEEFYGSICCSSIKISISLKTTL